MAEHMVAEIRAELSIKMIELEQAIDLGMPYAQLKELYNAVKALQYEVTLAEIHQNMSKLKTESSDIVIE